jgi:hypothetical protein
VSIDVCGESKCAFDMSGATVDLTLSGGSILKSGQLCRCREHFLYWLSSAAKRLGISAGVGNNQFAPNKEITRQEMFTLMYNTLKALDQLPQGSSGKTLSSFTDAEEITEWAKEAMAYLVETGIVQGTGELLTPLKTTTRAEMGQVLNNLLET